MRETPKLLSLKLPMASPESAGNTCRRTSLGGRGFRGHGLTSSLQGIGWNRRGPLTTANWSRRALERTGRPERFGVKGRWESDPLIVVMKPAKEAVS